MDHSKQILNLPLILSNFEGLYLARWCMVVRGWGANLLNRPPTKSTSIFMPLISPTSEIWWNHFGGKFKFCWRCVLKKREPRRNSNITHSTSRPANRGLTQTFCSASLGTWKQQLAYILEFSEISSEFPEITLSFGKTKYDLQILDWVLKVRTIFHENLAFKP